MTPFLLTLTLILVALCSARLTRLVVFDSYPPAHALRSGWKRLVGEDSVWSMLVTCHYCASPYLTALVWFPVFALNDMPFGWGFALVVWGALAYVAAIIVSFDGDNS